MNHWITAPLAHRLGLAVLHSTWELLAVAAALWCALAITAGRSPAVRYRLACAALAAAVAGPVATFLLLATPSIAPHPPTVAVVSSVNAATGSALAPVKPFAVPAGATPGDPPTWDHLLPCVSAAWAVGVAIVGIWNGLGWLGVQRLRRRGVTPVDPDLERAAARLADRIGVRQAVQLLASARVDSPLVVGFLRPLILLPASLITELPPEQLEALLAHELAHVHRQDYAVNLLQCAAETLLFYHPAAWWISRRIRVEREHCCDDIAVGLTDDRVGYAHALAAVAESRVNHLLLAAGGAALLPRIRRLLGLHPEPAHAVPRLVAAAIAVLCVGGGMSFWTTRTAHAKGPTTMPANDVVIVRGRVLDPAGRPFAGAAVAVGSADGYRGPAVVVVRGTSAADGTFAIAVPAPEGSDPAGSTVAASAPGFGPAAAPIRQGGDPLELKLVTDDVPIEGRLLDEQGKPVAGARVQLQYAVPYVIDLNQTDAAGNPTRPVANRQGHIPTFAGDLSATLTTGADGRFHLAGVGRERTVDLLFRAPGFALAHARVLTRPGPRVSKTVMQYLPRTFVTFGSTFDYTLVPGSIVEGTVTDATTGEPVPGVVVDADWFADPTWLYSVDGLLRATTDGAGHYRLDAFPRGKTNRLVVLPPGDQPYLSEQHNLPDAAAIHLDVPLHRGVWMAGRATDGVTGRPVVGRLSYNPLTSNAVAAALPQFAKNASSWPPRGYLYETRPDGTYRMAVPPGPAVVGIQFTDEPYRLGVGADTIRVRPFPDRQKDVFGAFTPELMNVVQLADIPATGATNVDFRLDPGATLHVKTVDPVGQPMVGVTVYHRVMERVIGGDPQRMAAATFDAICFAPDERRTLVFRDDDRSLGVVVPVGPAELKAGAITAQLRPMAKITGRLVDRAGNPVAAARVDDSTDTYTTTTDAAGRFTAVLPVGSDYTFNFIKGDPGGSMPTYGFSKKCTVSAGQATDVGDVRIKGDED